MEPIVYGLEDQYSNKINFLYIDREDPSNAEIVAQYNINSQPIFILLDAQGNEV